MINRRTALATMAALMSVVLSVATAVANDGLAAPSIDKPIGDFSLPDCHGRLHSLRDYRSSRLIVVAFLGTECPLAALYGPRLESLADRYRSNGVQFLTVNSNDQDTLGDIADFGRRHALSMPQLKDVKQRVADKFGAQRTPEVFLLDVERRIRYRGRIDDQYAIGVQRDAPKQQDLRRAIEQVLNGEPVSAPVTAPIGCLIGRRPDGVTSREFTYYEHVEPIIRRRCVTCHREGQLAPFTLQSFADVADWSAMIREVVHDGRMPPWFANPKHDEFRNDMRLSTDERTALLGWIDNGCPSGFPRSERRADVAPNTWRIPTPDRILAIADHAVEIPAEGALEYQYFSIDPGFDKDVFIQAVEVRPGNPRVVHHALVSVTTEDRSRLGVGNNGVLINYAPGMQPTNLPAGTAIRIPAGARLLVQMHYTPNGTAQQDLTRIGIVFADPRTVTRHAMGGAIANPQIEIPAGADNHRETARLAFDGDVYLYGLSPHMHLRGKAFRYEAEFSDGNRELLLDVPAYDFNWQLRYVFEKPRFLPRGTQIVCTAWYDNSTNNAANPNPKMTVRWGDQTWEEMLIGFYSVIVEVDAGSGIELAE